MQIAYDQSTVYAEELKSEVVERRRGEEALRGSEEKYRSLVESAEDSVYLVDVDSNYLFMNEKHLSRFGLPNNEVMDRPYGDFHSAEETKAFTEKVDEVFKTSQSVWHEYRPRDPTPTSPENGGYWDSGGRDCPRLQQCADGHPGAHVLDIQRY
ncbi:MAG: PAS domain-containing protein [Deltaproteobacteria bacterium]|nr:PAS domain-containing protein [Deltaproteobacteria bacterium]